MVREERVGRVEEGQTSGLPTDKSANMLNHIVCYWVHYIGVTLLIRQTVRFVRASKGLIGKHMTCFNPGI